MDELTLFDSLDGLFAYDNGSIDSGINDTILRAKVKVEMQKLAELEAVPKFIDKFCYQYYMSPKRRKQGYGMEDAIEFIKWLEELMGWKII